MNASDTSTTTPNEEFFIRKFSSQKDDKAKLNSEILRGEEKLEFGQRLTSRDSLLHVRDFKTVCREEPLVRFYF